MELVRTEDDDIDLRIPAAVPSEWPRPAISVGELEYDDVELLVTDMVFAAAQLRHAGETEPTPRRERLLRMFMRRLALANRPEVEPS